MTEPGRVPSTTRTRLPSGPLQSTCSECGEVSYEPDKGIGRARLAAWESRHGANCTRIKP